MSENEKEFRKGFANIPLSQIPWKEYMEAKNYDPDIDNMCKRCIKEQTLKYGEQNIECKGLASADMLLDESIKHLFSEDDLIIAEQLANPYAWADANINKKKFVSRWYQEQFVRCTSKRLTLRCGRRAGKSFSLALKMLHRAMTTESKVLIVTPYEIQAEELVNLMLEFIWAMNPDYGTYDSIIEKYVKSPTHLIKLKNGSRIRAFTTGSSGAGSVRGQSADIICLDEVDYMSEADFNSILAILADNPDVELWVASTPNGKTQLYRLENLEEYKSFHFPSFVLPHYNDKLDKEFKGQFTDIGYVQEVMAEFGETEAGVFQDFFIEKNTISDIDRLDVIKNRGRYIIVLGGDWNDDKNGTRLLAIAFDKETKQFFVCDKRRVSKEGWTQVAAVKEIIEFNRKYRFDHIYLDEGYGVSNIQFIRQYGLDKRATLPPTHPDLNLIDVVGINFSSKVEVLPVEGGDPIKKDMKVYLVENAVRLLERDAIKLDIEFDKDLIAQMRNYVVLRKTPTGKPVYGTDDSKVGDHDLDAFMVGLLGWSMENSSFLNHAISDVLVKLVSREDMDNKEGADYIGTSQLFASNFQRKPASTLFNEKINRYNRATFNKNTYNSPLKSNGTSNKFNIVQNNSSRRSVF